MPCYLVAVFIMWNVLHKHHGHSIVKLSVFIEMSEIISLSWRVVHT